jgi:hypothetical protein
MAKAEHEHPMKMHHMEIHPKEGGGWEVQHHHEPTASKSGAFMTVEAPQKHQFGAEEHEKMMAHVHEHTGGEPMEHEAMEEEPEPEAM